MATDFHDRERVHAERNAEHTAKLKEAVAKMRAERMSKTDDAEYRAYMDAFGIPYPTVQQQTDTHLAALDAALGVAVQNVKRDARFQLRKTSQGRWALLGPAAFYDETHCREYMEAITAFLYGDLALALQKRDEFIATFEVAP